MKLIILAVGDQVVWLRAERIDWVVIDTTPAGTTNLTIHMQREYDPLVLQKVSPETVDILRVGLEGA